MIRRKVLGESSCGVIVLLGLVNCFTDYFDLLWPSDRVAVTVSKELAPDFLLLTISDTCEL